MKSAVEVFLSLIFVVLFFGVAVAQDPGTDNIAHLWNFEGATLDDAVGQAHGVASGENAFVLDGELLLLPNADGVADTWIDLPGEEISMYLYEEVAVAAWFRPDPANTQWNALWYFGDDANGAGFGANGYCFQPSRNDDVARTWISCGNATAPWSVEDAVNDTTGGNTEYDDGELHHVVSLINSEGIIKLYHNGVYLGADTLESDAATGKDNAIANISPNFARLAASTYGGDLPWLGTIYEVAIYNRALTDGEVQWLYENANPVLSVRRDDGASVPEAFSLSQNFPNPFNPTTEITYSLTKREQVKLTVNDVLGREIATLVDRQQGTGEYTVTFDAQALSSGIYFYRLKTNEQVLTRRMLLVK